MSEMPAPAAALAIRSKAAATSGRIPSPAGTREGRCSRRRSPSPSFRSALPRQLRRSPWLPPGPGGPRGELAHHRRLRPDRRKRAPVGEGDGQARWRDPVGARGRHRGGAGPSQIGGLAEMGRVRRAVRQERWRQQLRQVVTHRAGRRDRGQVGSSLRPALGRSWRRRSRPARGHLRSARSTRPRPAATPGRSRRHRSAVPQAPAHCTGRQSAARVGRKHAEEGSPRRRPREGALQNRYAVAAATQVADREGDQRPVSVEPAAEHHAGRRALASEAIERRCEQGRRRMNRDRAPPDQRQTAPRASIPSPSAGSARWHMWPREAAGTSGRCAARRSSSSRAALEASSVGRGARRPPSSTSRPGPVGRRAGAGERCGGGDAIPRRCAPE